MTLTPQLLRTGIPFLVAPALAAGLLGGCGSDPGPQRAERVILISCDTLRADHLGVYGYDRPTSPRLDAFARQCVVFDEAYSCAPMTQPAVSSLLTGRLPSEVGTTPGNIDVMPASVTTLAERLELQGMATAAVVSNFILRRLPPSQGDVGVQQGFAHFDDEMEAGEAVRAHVKERIAADTTDAALAWLGERPSDEFFLWVHYQDPHGPYTPPPEYAELFAGPGSDRTLELGPNQFGEGVLPNYQALGDERDPAVYRDLYDAEIRYFDTELGRLLDALEGEGLLDGALVVFTSDHGEALGEHDFWFCHGESVHREVVRVPLLVRWPDGAVPAHQGQVDAEGWRRRGDVASHLDVVPTVLHALDLFDAEARGRSLLEPAPEGARVLPQDLYPQPGTGKVQWHAASDGTHRLIWGPWGNRPRLFDVTVDPGEQNDLAPARAQRARALHELRNAFVEDARTISGSAAEFSREDLEKMGYAGRGGSGPGSADEPTDR